MPARNGQKEARTRALQALFASILIAATAGPSGAAAGNVSPPGRTTRITIYDVEGKDVGSNASVSISPDGGSFLIRTTSPLVPDDKNGVRDIYLQDRATGSVEWISVTNEGGQPNGPSDYLPWRPLPMSNDGRYVAFTSYSTNMTGSDANGATSDVYLRDRVAGTTRLVSVSSQGVQGDRQSLYATVSDDGRAVAFLSFADNLVASDTNPVVDSVADVFVHDVVTGTTERVSVISGGRQAPYYATPEFLPQISGNGRYVTFEYRFPLDPTSPNTSLNDIFVHDRVTNSTERVSVASDGSDGRFGGLFSSREPMISAEGRYVVFASDNTNLIPNDTNGYTDVFVHDRQTGQTERLAGPDGQQSDTGMYMRGLSADGRFVLVYSAAANLGYEDGNGTTDVHRIDRLTGQVDLVSTTPLGTTGNLASLLPSMSADGRYVAFSSSATDLLNDGNGGGWFLRDLGPPTGAGELSAAPGADGVDVSGWARFSAGPIAASEDSDHDAAPGARNAGAELTGTQITYRPERKDLRIRLDLAPRPHAGRPQGSGMPGGNVQAPGALTYAMRFTVDGVSYEARAVAGPSGQPDFFLYRCAPVCTKTADLSGGIGTAGESVLMSLPLEAIGAAEGSALEDGVAYVAVGEQLTGPVTMFDDVALPDREIPASSVDLGMAPRGTPEGAVAFDQRAELVDGRFVGILTTPGTGEHDVWARVCLGEVCSVGVATVVG